MNYRISRDLEYALMALSYMFKKQGFCVSAREISQQLNCRFYPFSRVLQRLVNQKIIISKQGIRGGYLLNKNLEDLSFYHLMKAVLPSVEIADCISGPCDLFQNCNIKSPIHYLNKQFLSFYKSLNVYEILSNGSYWKKNRRKKKTNSSCLTA